MKQKKITINILLLLCGIVSLWLVISHIVHFEYPDYFGHANPDIKTYVGINVMSKWVDFSFFTYITMLLFGIWCILLSISKLFNLQKMNDFLTQDWLVCFIFVNYIFHYFALHCFSNIVGRFRSLFHSKATGLA